MTKENFYHLFLNEIFSGIKATHLVVGTCYSEFNETTINWLKKNKGIHASNKNTLVNSLQYFDKT